MSVFSNAYPIALPQKNINILLEAFYNVSNPESSQYGKYWTQEQINNLVKPDDDYVEKIISSYKEDGFKCFQIGGDALECSHQCPKIQKYNISQIYSPAHSIGDGDGYVGREV